MSSFNKVILMGNLTRAPELRYSNNQMAICKAGIALNHRYKKGDEWEESVTFVDFTIFGKRAEAFEKYHGKGDKAFLEGSLRLDQWEDKQDGSKRSKLYVVADSWEFVGQTHDRTDQRGVTQRDVVNDMVESSDDFFDQDFPD